jgi:hypothetical protein
MGSALTFSSNKITAGSLRYKTENTGTTLFFFVMLGFELRVYTLTHSTSPFLKRLFRDRDLQTICPDRL